MVRRNFKEIYERKILFQMKIEADQVRFKNTRTGPMFILKYYEKNTFSSLKNTDEVSLQNRVSQTVRARSNALRSKLTA